MNKNHSIWAETKISDLNRTTFLERWSLLWQKNHVGIGIAAIAAGAGAATYMKKKFSEKAKEGTDGCPVSGLPEHRTRKTGEK